jgi:hypothetical protein
MGLHQTVTLKGLASLTNGELAHLGVKRNGKADPAVITPNQPQKEDSSGLTTERH